MSRCSKLIFSLLLIIGIQAFGSYFTEEGMGKWYESLNKAPWTPPGIAFAIVWPILYFLIALSLWMVWIQPARKKKALTAFFCQISLNFLWPILFFYLHQPLWGFIVLLFLITALIWNIIEFYKLSKWSAYILLPYLTWLLFALTLNGYIMIYN